MDLGKPGENRLKTCFYTNKPILIKQLRRRYDEFDILPRLKRVGFLCASAGRRIRYGLTPAPQFGDAPPK